MITETTEMTHPSRFFSAGSVIVLAALAAHPALAATQAGTTITNSVTVNFQVGGIAQTASSASDTLTVDRKVAVTVAEVGGAATTVSPGQSSAVTVFTVTNNSNATLDFSLSAVQVASGGAAAHGGTDGLDTTSLRIFVEADTTAGFSGGDTLVTYLDQLAGDGASKTVYVVSDVPLTSGGAALANGAIAAIVLSATARDGGTAGSEGAALTQTTTANTAGMDTVFADSAGATDASRDGAHSAKDDYSVYAAMLSVSKLSAIVSDPVNGTSNPKFIPGATIEYCIAVSNAAGSATATNVALSDTIPAQVTYDSGYGIYVNGTVNGSSQCNSDGSAGGNFDGTTVTGTLSDIAQGVTRTMRFRATIN